MINLQRDLNFIPKKKNILLHVRIKNTLTKKLNYKRESLKLLNYFKKNQKSILVPCFTYSFCKNKRINLKTKKSEVGRFSEGEKELSHKRRIGFRRTTQSPR